MTNDEFHARLDTLARETHEAMAISSNDRQVLRDALEEAIRLDHELHHERRYSMPITNGGSVEVVKVN